MNSTSNPTLLSVRDILGLPAHRRITTRLYVQSAEVLLTRKSQPFLYLSLTDRTGRIGAVVWGADTPPELGHLVDIGAKTRRYQDNGQLTVDYLEAAGPPDDISQWLPTAEEEPR